MRMRDARTRLGAGSRSRLLASRGLHALILVCVLATAVYFLIDGLLRLRYGAPWLPLRARVPSVRIQGLGRLVILLGLGLLFLRRLYRRHRESVKRAAAYIAIHLPHG